jgi:hypothetical protein
MMGRSAADDGGSGLSQLFELVDKPPQASTRCDGGRFFPDTIVLAPAREVTMPAPGRWQFATIEDDVVAVDHRGRIWRTDASLDDDICEGTRLERWLAGAVDAAGLVYDGDGEFADNIFDDDGEIEPVVREKQIRLHLKRDPRRRCRPRPIKAPSDAQRDGRRRRSHVCVGRPRMPMPGEVKGASTKRACRVRQRSTRPVTAGRTPATQTGDDIRAPRPQRELAPTLKRESPVRESSRRHQSAKGLVSRAARLAATSKCRAARRVEGICWG